MKHWQHAIEAELKFTDRSDDVLNAMIKSKYVGRIHNCEDDVQTKCVSLNTTPSTDFGVTVNVKEADDAMVHNMANLKAEVFNLASTYDDEAGYQREYKDIGKMHEVEMCDAISTELPSTEWLRSQRAYLRSLPPYMLMYLRRYVSGAGGDVDLYTVVNGIASRAPRTTESFTVWRGMKEKKSHWLINSMKTGQIKPEYFTPISVATRTRIALGFAGNLMIKIRVPKGVSVLAIGGYESEILLPSQTLKLTDFRIKPYIKAGDGCAIVEILTANATVSQVAEDPMPSAELASKQTMILAMQQVSLGPSELMIPFEADEFNAKAFDIPFKEPEVDHDWMVRQRMLYAGLSEKDKDSYWECIVPRSIAGKTPPLTRPMELWTHVEFAEEQFDSFQAMLLDKKYVLYGPRMFTTPAKAITQMTAGRLAILFRIMLKPGDKVVDMTQMVCEYTMSGEQTLILTDLKRRVLTHVNKYKLTNVEMLTASATLV